MSDNYCITPLCITGIPNSKVVLYVSMFLPGIRQLVYIFPRCVIQSLIAKLVFYVECTFWRVVAAGVYFFHCIINICIVYSRVLKVVLWFMMSEDHSCIHFLS